ncbi:MAG: serine hydroxymethyltransferase [Bacillota bacterium]
MSIEDLKETDPDIASIIFEEINRQQESLNMIASENLASKAVLVAQGSVLTNKYAEGYPDARYYGGCFWVDRAEMIACERAGKLFAAEHVNVQPHSGTSANLAVYYALLEPGDNILGMELNQGGHLTHGHSVNISGRYYRAFTYGVNKTTQRLDLEQIRKIAKKTGPRLIIAGASSYPRLINFKGFKEIAEEVGAYLLVDMAHTAGFVAAQLHPNPVPFADAVTATTHKTLRGPRGGLILCKQKHASKIDKAIFPGLQGGPLMHTIAAKAVSFKEASLPGYKKYQQRVLENARALAEALMELNFDLVTGGTDTHQVLIDLRSKGVFGREAETVLEKVNISVNKNTIPDDERSANDPSGIRLGTPTLTSRGMGPEQMKKVASFIEQAIRERQFAERLVLIKQQVGDLCRDFPVY